MSDQEMSTNMEVLTNTEKLLDSFPEDQKSKIAKKELGSLRRRLNVSAPELRKSHFWQSRTGYYYICREFNGDDERSLAMMELYASTLENRT
jgi:hypothetical protein